MEYVLLYSEGTDPQPYDPAADNIGEWVDDLIARGISEYGERLRPGQDATSVRVRDGKVLVTDGPYTEAREWVGGFDVIDCADLDEAIEIASRHPAARSGTAEVRPFMVWPDAAGDHRVVPHGFPERPAKGRRYVMFVCVDPAGPGGAGGSVEPWVEEMDARGVRLFGDVLRPPQDAVLVRSRAGRTLITDAPLSEGKEWIAGFDFIEVGSLDEAVQVAAAHPMASTGVIVLSPAWEFDPYQDHVARDLREAAVRDVRTEPEVGAPS